MGKKILFGLLVLTGRFLFAQEAFPPALSEETLRSLVDNWDGIDEAMSGLEDTPQMTALGDDFEGFLDECQEFFEDFEGSISEGKFRSDFMRMRAYKAPPPVKQVFSRYGLGPRGFEVFFVSFCGIMAYSLDQAMAPYVEFVETAESTGIGAGILDLDLERARFLIDRIRFFKGLFHPQDMALIEEYWGDLKKLFN
ncbi:MAG: hypothetical protein LBQ14_05700 [Treponema sp.]|jgi:hypothetical protein|nr:hypothetical protein [Treponema sp.]